MQWWCNDHILQVGAKVNYVDACGNWRVIWKNIWFLSGTQLFFWLHRSPIQWQHRYHDSWRRKRRNCRSACLSIRGYNAGAAIFRQCSPAQLRSAKDLIDRTDAELPASVKVSWIAGDGDDYDNGNAPGTGCVLSFSLAEGDFQLLTKESRATAVKIQKTAETLVFLLKLLYPLTFGWPAPKSRRLHFWDIKGSGQ